MSHPKFQRFLAGAAAKPLLFCLLLMPLVWLVYGAAFDRLGANPAEALVRATGDWTLRMLCLVLFVTPLRVMGGLPALARLRRMVGLFVFFYVLLHFMPTLGSTWAWTPTISPRTLPSALLSWWALRPCCFLLRWPPLHLTQRFAHLGPSGGGNCTVPSM